MPELNEAATLKSQAQALMRDAERILKDKTLPAAVRKEIEDVRKVLRRTWADLEAEADGDKKKEEGEGEEAEERTDMAQEVAEAEVMKTEGGKKYPKDYYLVVEDTEKPTTWHLPWTRDGEPDHRLMGAAKAALTAPGGYRGEKYEGPDKGKAVAKLKALYKKEEMEWSEMAEKEIREATTSFAGLRASRKTHQAIDTLITLTYDFRILAENIIYSPDVNDKSSRLRALASEFSDEAEKVLDEISEQPMTEVEQAPLVEAELTESLEGNVLALHESQETGEPASPLRMDVAVIRPGWGNKKDNHYYGPDMLKNHAGVFEGAKMYATDHRDDERSVRTWVSTIEKCPVRFADDGSPVASVVVHKPWFSNDIRNLAEAGMLEKMECSILAKGTARPNYEQDGRKGSSIEAITEVGAVDWVTRAGAGGRALNLAEADTQVMEDEMEDEKAIPEGTEGTEEATTAEVEIREDGSQPAGQAAQEQGSEQEAEPAEEAAPEVTPEVKPLAEAQVNAVLAEAKLPDVSRQRLVQGSYADEDALRQAVAAEVAYVAELTGAGRPVGQEPASTQKDERSYEEKVREAYDDIDRKYGLLRE